MDYDSFFLLKSKFLHSESSYKLKHELFKNDKGNKEMIYDSFTDKVIEHFMCPRNVGSMPDADVEGTCGDPGCGDYLTVFIKVKDNLIENIRFQVFGCVAAITTSSMATELVNGKSLEEALKLTDTDITEVLGGLPENKIHCSVLGATAIKNAIENYIENSSSSKNAAN